ncbi:C-GCAxxG-C-C family (seleno)protein [Acidaminobacter hydrogenoformans]|uniref:C_GCAxxG_C_C family probable redox protein n=1 Tax=Acidaminobacter hydrogenoformans DSM 2784 TaxID=1120920 RepID=A0A1G5RQY1_9FIRM|nr:C-GCAxxG-C-C family (seleno)protein [Acidaminobacter hydrogenoformans]SCZ76406.1 C_GCAxxG_C_C family probable redox protein [Acidaminobacter hydrogenoformans DSM 2784]
MTYIEAVRHFRDKEKYDYSCSETMVAAADKAFELNLPPQVIRAMAPFGGGLQTEDVCGILTGGLAVIGMLYTKSVAHDSAQMTEVTRAFISAFKEKFATSQCVDLKAAYRNEETGCTDFIIRGAEVLAAVIEANPRA